MDPDISYTNFVKIKTEYENLDFNEADTRAKIIDRILIDCLGWSENNIKRETKVHSGYTDYEISIDGRNRLVVEAKNTGEYFSISDSNRKRNYKINGAISSNKNLIYAINQVQSYCSDIGGMHSVITNGKQFVVFTAMSIGKPWRDNYALIFHSLNDVLKNFSLFLNVLSFDAVQKNVISSILDGKQPEKQFRVVIDSIHNPNEIWARNFLYTYIKPISEFVFSELLDDRKAEVLDKCYIYERATKDLCIELDGLFIDQIPHYARELPISEIKDDKEGAGSFGQKISEFSYQNITSEIIVLLGGVGAGKSTFIYRYFRILLPNKDKVIYFITDFRNSGQDKNQISDYIYKSIIDIWDDEYSIKYNTVLNIREYISKEKPYKEQVMLLIKLLKSLNKYIILIIDNVDQHNLDYQESLYIEANHIKDSIDIAIIISLREETFMKSKRSGVFDAYNVNRFFIPSPNLLSLLKRRILFTLKMLKKDVQDFLSEGHRFKYNEDIRYKLEAYFKVLFFSFKKTNDQSRRLIRVLDNVSCGNMRFALDMFNGFLQSGNTDVQSILDIYDTSYYHEYQISTHQFIKSIMLGEYRFYDESRSSILNIFDFDVTLTDSHFHRLRLLNYLAEREHKKSPLRQKGFISINEILTLASQVLINENAMINSIMSLAEHNLIEYDNLTKSDYITASYIRITFSGKFYLRGLIQQLVYYDLIAISTPISNLELSNLIYHNCTNNDLNYRIAKTMTFVNYLLQSEKAEFDLYPEYTQNELTNCIFSDKIRTAITHQFDIIVKKLNEKGTFTDKYLKKFNKISI